MTSSSSTQRPAYGERAIAEAELFCFDNPRQGRPYDVAISLPEFTCKCPFSGYPDYGSATSRKRTELGQLQFGAKPPKSESPANGTGP